MTPQLVIQLVLSGIVVIGFFVMTALYLFHPQAFEGAVEKQLTLITGAMIGSFISVVNWAIQSNIGTARTKELLAKAEPIKEADCVEVK
jgi:uncharacterized membrane protein